MEDMVIKDNSAEEKYGRIITNAVIETNRVLNIWCLSNKQLIYEDKLSLFRGWFARFCKIEFGWAYYNHNLRNLDIKPLFHNNQVIDLSLASFPKKMETEIKYIKNIDILKIIELNPVYQIESNIQSTKINVDYNKIKNIKF